jgi:4-amino-4-deoxy-L-arabinose transferase-like glycosyltransferase
MGRLPELFVLTVGLGLRLSMVFRYDPMRGYDASDHWPYIEWLRTSWSFPPLTLSRETYQPPLYYVTAALFRRFGVEQAKMNLPSVLFASLTLVLIWVGLERYVPKDRVARIFALALAAVLPCGVQIAGMMTAEGMNGFLATSALLLAARMLSRPGERRVFAALALGVILGLEMLTKISALVIVGSIAFVAVLEGLWGTGDLHERVRRGAPWMVMLVAFTATSGWYFARNQHRYGKALLEGVDGVDRLPPELQNSPYLEHRTLGFVLGWSNDIFDFPYYPSATDPHSRFWPVVIATTFNDYYNYAFATPEPNTIQTNDPVARCRSVRPSSIKFAKASVAAGTLIAVTNAMAWFWATYRCVRRKDTPRLLFLVAAGLVLLAQFHYAMKYSDGGGPIKGAYMLLASSSLFALFGLSVSWLARNRRTLPIAVLEIFALATVSTYTIYCRVT